MLSVNYKRRKAIVTKTGFTIRKGEIILKEAENKSMEQKKTDHPK